MVRNRSELENIVNPDVLDLIDKYHKHLATDLSMNIQFGMKNMKFSLMEFYKIIKRINIEFQKELADKTKTK